MPSHLIFSLLVALFASIPPAQAAPAPVHLDPTTLAQADAAISAAIARKSIPGAVLWIERQGDIYQKAYGHRALLPEKEPMSLNTIFDAASLTKVVATTPALMLLTENGLNPDDPVALYLPEFLGHEKISITPRHLLTHTSGLAPVLPRDFEWSGHNDGIALALAEPNRTPAESAFTYSDVNFIILAEIVRRVSGQPFNQFVQDRLFTPLGMTTTTFRPPDAWLTRIAPTTKQADGTFLRGIVHDPAARKMDGVAGHAGLFTTAEDLARYARMLLNHGEHDGKQILSPNSVTTMTSLQSPSATEKFGRRGFGWDIDSKYAGPRGDFPPGSFGHTGWTGTSLWIDPQSQTFVILLTNRNHPTENGSVKSLRTQIANIAAAAVTTAGFNFTQSAIVRQSPAPQAPSPVPGQTLNGIDVLEAQKFAPLKDLRLGLITNHTGRNRTGQPTIDLLHNADNTNLKALFSPEHGIRGEADENVADGTDKKTGLPVHSLYQDGRRKPSPEQLQDLDALVFDIQDIGTRFYTYISTMGLAMEAAAENNLKFFVLDRVNPIGGLAVDGPVHTGEQNFTGHHDIPIRHGMTVGELAQMFRAEKKLDLNLTVIPVKNWSRSQYFDATGLPWINPSPNMRNLTEAFLYPGVALLEFTNVSVGRGTERPFELVGAPWITDPDRFAQELNAFDIPGIRFLPVRFTPTASVHAKQPCGGVRLILTSRQECPTVDVGLALALALRKLHPNDWEMKNFNKLLKHPPTFDAVAQGLSLDDIHETWSEARTDFDARRKKFLAY